LKGYDISCPKHYTIKIDKTFMDVLKKIMYIAELKIIILKKTKKRK